MCICAYVYLDICIWIYICVFFLWLIHSHGFSSFTLFSHLRSSLRSHNVKTAFLLVFCYPSPYLCYSYLFAVIFIIYIIINFNFYIPVCLFVLFCFVFCFLLRLIFRFNRFVTFQTLCTGLVCIYGEIKLTK